MKQKSKILTLLKSGFTAGSLDAIAVFIAYYIWFGSNPVQVLQYVASGAHGPQAIGGGTLMVIAGLLYHFSIAYVSATIYFYAYPKIAFLGKYKIVAGLLFGLSIWLVMNLLVLPNSNTPQNPPVLSLAITSMVWHMVLVGLPISLITNRHYTT